MGITLPKIPIGRYIGERITASGPAGAKIVKNVNTGIKIVKDSKLSLKDILKDSGEAAVNAAAARINEGVNQAALTQGIQQNIVPILVVGAIIFLFVIGRRK